MAIQATDPFFPVRYAAGARGDELFNGKATCGRRHVEPLYTEPGWNLHTPEEIGIDSFLANRSPDGMYRTTPFKGPFAHSKGGFFRDGGFADLPAVVDHYNTHFNLGLTDQEKAGVVEYVNPTCTDPLHLFRARMEARRAWYSNLYGPFEKMI